MVSRRRLAGAAAAALVVACASVRPTTDPEARSPTSWTDSVLATLSRRDRAAQLVWPMVLGDYAATTSTAWAAAERQITREHVGGVIVSVGSPLEIAAKLNALQRLSPVPLVAGADYEFGAGYRARGGYFLPNAIDLGGATVFPPQMAVGATRDSTLAYEQGRVTAIEGRALGVHFAFAPILDVNNNPLNPVIGVRSYGEDPVLDARLGRAFVRGLQEHGMIATGKHFPGHGDTDQNSHLTLPTIGASRARMDTVELVPFRAAIAAGTGAIMTAHISLPALTGDSSTPATLSRRVMTDLLRRDLGFRGLLVTDAMDMNGVLANVGARTTGQTLAGTYGTINSIGLAEACKRAIEAGADVLLMPSDVPAAIDAVVAGVREGRFTQARVDSSVRRLLATKERLGLARRRLVDLDSVRTVVGDTSNAAVARRVAERSITLAKDSLRLVPVSARTRTLSVTIALRNDVGAGATFDAELRRALPSLRRELVLADAGLADTTRLLAAADSADVVIVSSYLATAYNSASATAPTSVVSLVRALQRRHPRTIVASFGNPYLVRWLPETSTYLLAWGGFPMSQRAAAQAMLGTNPITGQLPVRLAR